MVLSIIDKKKKIHIVAKESGYNYMTLNVTVMSVTLASQYLFQSKHVIKVSYIIYRNEQRGGA